LSGYFGGLSRDAV